MSTAIEFNHVSKQYRLGLVSTKTLSHDLQRWWTMNIRGKEDPYLKIGETNDRSTKGSSDYVWALKDIDFKVEQGDVVGIIGKNGAGKSTLLKLVSKVTGPTTGSIRARGRIGALLEVGTGFHPEMTGRENIFLNGAILGMSKHEIAAKLDEIVDFSGCERYLDTPVKRYSSGMMVRLGFAVAAHLDPEILVVDEVLAVGDAEFQKKAIGKMQDVSKGEGRTVLFVSHNMGSVRQLCKSGIVLEKGEIVYQGNVSDAISHYLQMSGSEKDFKSRMIIHIRNKAMSINKVLVNNSGNCKVSFVGNGVRKISISIIGQLEIDMNLSTEIMLYDNNEMLIGSYSPTHWDGSTYKCFAGEFEISDDIILPEMLTSGKYSLSMRLSQMNIEEIAFIDKAVEIEVVEFSSPITGNVYHQSYTGSLVIR